MAVRYVAAAPGCREAPWGTVRLFWGRSYLAVVGAGVQLAAFLVLAYTTISIWGNTTLSMACSCQTPVSDMVTTVPLRALGSAKRATRDRTASHLRLQSAASMTQMAANSVGRTALTTTMRISTASPLVPRCMTLATLRSCRIPPTPSPANPSSSNPSP